MSNIAERLQLALPAGKMKTDDGYHLIREAITEINELQEQVARLSALAVQDGERLSAMTAAKNTAKDALKRIVDLVEQGKDEADANLKMYADNPETFAPELNEGQMAAFRSNSALCDRILRGLERHFGNKDLLIEKLETMRETE